jgi:3D (Asp-Asp-Asp) domain-containing protein
VRVVRVRENIELQEVSIPYTSEQVADPTLELDQTRIVQAGKPGVRVTRIRVRTEDGKEVSRQKEDEWLAAEPQTQKVGYGTKIVVRTLDTPDGPIQYYRKVTVYATSYAPCNFIPFIGRCSYTTAAGYPLQKGVIGVGEVWYNIMKGWNVYVEGYGPARVGDYGYVPGYWVDLGYSDADFINWHRNTTLYFLAPAPANVPWILPK